MPDDARTSYLDALDIHARYGFTVFNKTMTPAELEDSLIALAKASATWFGRYLREMAGEIFTSRGVDSGLAVLEKILDDLDREAEAADEVGPVSDGTTPIMPVDEIFSQFTAMRDIVPVGIAIAFQTGDRRFELRTPDVLAQSPDRLMGILVEKVT